MNFEVLTKSEGTAQEVQQEVQTAAQPLAQQQIANYNATNVVVAESYKGMFVVMVALGTV